MNLHLQVLFSQHPLIASAFALAVAFGAWSLLKEICHAVSVVTVRRTAVRPQWTMSQTVANELERYAAR